MAGKSVTKEGGPIIADRQYWVLDIPDSPEILLFTEQGGFTTPEIFLAGINEGLAKVGTDFASTSKEQLEAFLEKHAKEAVFSSAEVVLLQWVVRYHEYFKQRLLGVVPVFEAPETETENR